MLGAFADVDDVRKLRLEVDNAWSTLKTRLEEVKDTLPFAEQLLQYEVGINEVLAVKLAVDEKTDMEAFQGELRLTELLRKYAIIHNWAGLKKNRTDCNNRSLCRT